MIFKRENDSNEKESKNNESIEKELSIFGTYSLMWKLLKLAPVKQLVIILLTHNVNKIFLFNGYIK